MKFRPHHRRSGSALFLAAGAIAVISMISGVYFLAMLPKYRSVHQASSWRQAQEGALAGVNYAVRTLNAFALQPTNPDSYPWDTDWAGNPWSYSAGNPNGNHTLDPTDLPNLGGSAQAAVTSLTVDVYTRQGGSGNPWFRVRSSARANLPSGSISGDRRDLELRRMLLNTSVGGKPDPHVTRTLEVILKPKSRFSRAITTVQGLTLGN